MRWTRALARLAVLLMIALPGAAVSAPASLAALPLTVLPASGRGDTLAVFYSGDGGWAAADVGISDGMIQAGIPVVGVNSLRYFLQRRTPDGAAADLTLVLRHYMAAWGKTRIVLAGYSFGASAVPLIAIHLPADLRNRVRLVALVDPERAGELQFWPGAWLNVSRASATPIAPALAALNGLPIVCIYGDQEPAAACAALPRELAHAVRVPGGHHYGGDYGRVSRAMLADLPR